MTLRAAIARLSLVLALLVGACQSTSPAKSDPAADRPPARPGMKAETPPQAISVDRNKLYFDLAQYTDQWSRAKAEGKTLTGTSLEASVLRPMVDRNLTDLLETLGKPDAGPQRITAARALGFATDQRHVVPALTGVLSESDPNLVSSALASLYVLANPQTHLSPLVALLNHEDQDVRANDALALYAVLHARRRDGDTVPMNDEEKAASGRLLGLVSNHDEDQGVRANAVAALGELRDPMSTDVFMNLLTDPASPVRTRAAVALGQLGREQAIPPLIDALGNASAVNEKKVVTAALENIAKVCGLPVDAGALGTDPSNWKNWYMAVKRPASADAPK